MSQRRVSWIISANIDQWSKNLNAAGKNMDRFASNVQKQGRALTSYVSAPLAAFSGMALRSAANFEESMNRVGAISQATGDDLTRLEQTARDLGATTAFSASQAADGMSFLAQAGFDVNEVIGSMPSVLNLAAAAKMDLASAADIASNIMSGFGMTTDELGGAVDVMAKTMTSANTDVSQLGEAMKMVGPVASGFGVQFEETAAAVGFLSDAGLQASQAGTGLRQVMTTLSQKSEQLGVNVMDAAGNMLPLADIIQQLETRGLSATEAMEVFGERGGPALQVLLSRGSDALRSMTGELENAGGTAQRVADQQLKGFNGMLKQLGSAWEELQITFMSSGGLESSTSLLEHGTRLLRSMTEWYKNLGEQAQQSIQNILIGLTAVGPAMIAVGAAISGLSIAIGALTSPITLTIAAIAGLAAAVGYVYENWEAIIERVSDITWWRNTILEMAALAAEYSFPSLFIKGLNKVIDIWQNTDWFMRGLKMMGNMVLKYNPISLFIKSINKVLEFMGAELIKPMQGVNEEIERTAAIPNPYEMIASGLRGMKTEATDYKNEMKSLLDTVLDAIERVTGINYGGIFSGGAGGAEAAVTEWVETTQKALDATPLTANLQVTPPDPANLKAATVPIENTITQIESRWDQFKTNFKNIGGDIQGFLEGQITNAVISFGEILGNAVAGAENSWATTFEQIIMVVLDFAKSLASLAAGIGGVMLFIPGFQAQGAGLLAASGALIAAITAGQAILNKRAESRRNSVTSVNDALIRSDGSIVKFHPDDNILAMRDFGALSTAGGGRAGKQVIHNRLMLDGDVVWNNQKFVDYKKRR